MPQSLLERRILEVGLLSNDSPVHSPISKPASTSSEPDPLVELTARVEDLDEILRQQIVRLHAIEQFLAGHSSDAPVPGASPSSATPSRPFSSTQSIHPGEARGESIPVTRPDPVPTFRQSIGFDQLERRVAGNWFNRIGIVAVLFSIAFFLKYAIEHEWMGPRGRVFLGGFAGLLLLVWGGRMERRGYRQYGQGLSGGGIAVFYLTIQAAFALYGLVGMRTAFLLLAGVTGLAGWLAVRRNALALAILGLIGGFLTPVLLSTGEDNQAVLFTYLLLLDLGVLAVAHRRQWPALYGLAFVGTALLTWSWWRTWYLPEKVGPTLFWTTLLFLVFASLPIVSRLARRSAASLLDALLLFANGGLYCLALSELLQDGGAAWRGGGVLLLALLFAGQAKWVERRGGEDPYLRQILWGMPVVFGVLALPLQWDQRWVTMGWAMEGAVLSVVGWSTGRRTTRIAAGVIFLIAIACWMGGDLSAAGFQLGQEESFLPFFNLRGGSMGILLLSLLVAAWAARRWAPQANAAGLPLFAATLLATLWVSLDILDFFGQRIDFARRLVDPLPDGQRVVRWLETWKVSLLSTLWSLSGAGLLWGGIVGRRLPSRLVGLLLLLSSAVLLLAIGGHGELSSWQWILLNPLFGAYLALASALLVGSRHYRRLDGRGWLSEAGLLIPLLLALGWGTLLVGLRWEVEGTLLARLREMASFRDFDETLARGLLLSILYALQAGTMITIGMARDRRVLRVLGLLLMSGTIGKVFLFDLAGLDQLYRILSFLVLGVTLLLISYLYQRHLRREEDDLPPST